ncbi:MAG: NusG domain II-containing protein [Bulleidia sp.]
MKKKEILIVAGILIICLCAIFGMKFLNRNTEPTGDNVPTQKAEGQWVAIVHRNHVAKWFDSGIDGEYSLEGDYGEMIVEVKDGRWHVKQVECPNQNCFQMGWDDGNSFMPITCIPNNIFIATADWVEGYLDQ